MAEDIGMHESTISRVTTNKYAYTPQGIFELKYFFNSSINAFMVRPSPRPASRRKSRQIIDSEDPRKPYSDDKIAEILKEANINIARRTVAKYREMMGVLPSNKRKQFIGRVTMQTSVTFKNLRPFRTFEIICIETNSTASTNTWTTPPKPSVVLSVEKFRHIAEINITGDRLNINGKEETNDMYSAIDMVLDKLEKQIKKNKEKIRSRRPAPGQSPKGLPLNIRCRGG